MEKICSKCNESKPTEEFLRGNICKVCRKIYEKEYREKNAEKIKEYHKNIYINNKDSIIKRTTQYLKNNPHIKKNQYLNKIDENRRKRKEYYYNNKDKSKKYKEKNRDKIRKRVLIYINNKLRTDVNFKILHNLRRRLHHITTDEIRKYDKTINLTGCSISELKIYLESKFLPTMTWENYGPLWHIDHIVPCYSFDLSKEEEQRKCFHYTNLQPLFAVTTIINGIEYIGNLNKQNRLI